MSQALNIRGTINKDFTDMTIYIGAIQVLRNAVGGWRLSDFPEKSVMKMYGSTLLALRGGGWVSNFQ